MKKIFQKTKNLFILFVLFLLIPTIAIKAISIPPLPSIPLPSIPSGSSTPATSTVLLEIGPTENIPDLAVRLYNWLVRIAGVLALLMIILGGVQYTFFSTASPGKVEDAKDKIRQAIIGLLIVLASWLILNIINPELVNPPP
ncbi:hypothetical protein H5T58_01185 [Candidatus Parcubacteria bacterium]|nr:hypothetical protein [Candidatus Parcubacteria bacterium]